MATNGTPGIGFEEVPHIYKWKGLIVPSNTQVLRASGHGVSKFYTEDGREIGKATHLACRYYDEGRLDWASLDTPTGVTEHEAKMSERVRLRLASYVKFREETGFQPDLIEFVTYSEHYNVAGTIDRTGKFPGSDDIVLLDLKGGAEQEWHGYQTAGYALMEFPDNYFNIKRGALYLKDNGQRAQLRLHTKKTDFQEFELAAANFHKAQRACI